MSEYIYEHMQSGADHMGRPVEQPTLVQREEVVRCRDCEWFTPEYFYEEERGYGVVEILSDPPDCGNPERCSHHYDSLAKKTVPVHIVTDPDGFCAWAKRKEGGE